jgi:hypothetical protein
MDVQGVSLSTTFSLDLQGVSPSPPPTPAVKTCRCIPFTTNYTSSLDMQGVSLYTGRVGCIPFALPVNGRAGCIPFHRKQCVQDVSLSTTSSTDGQGVSLSPAVCMCRVYPFPLQAEWTCRAYPFPLPAVWTGKVYPFPPPAVWLYSVQGVSISTTNSIWPCRVNACHHQHYRHTVMGVFLSNASSMYNCTCRVWVYPFPPPAVWTCRVYPFPLLVVWTCSVYPFPPPAVWPYRVYPPAVWACRVNPFPSPALLTIDIKDVQNEKKFRCQKQSGMNKNADAEPVRNRNN